MSTKATYSGVLKRREQADAALRDFESKVGSTVLSVWPEFGDMKVSAQKAIVKAMMDSYGEGSQRAEGKQSRDGGVPVQGAQ